MIYIIPTKEHTICTTLHPCKPMRQRGFYTAAYCSVDTPGCTGCVYTITDDKNLGELHGMRPF